MEKTKVKEVALIVRGCHTDPKEKDKSNMNDSNKNIVEAHIVSYNNVLTEIEDVLLEDTIKEDDDFGKEVYIPIYTKYKNTILQTEQLIAPVNHKNRRMKFVNWQDKTKFKNFVYADDLIIIKPNKDRILPKFLYYILNTEAMLKKLNEGDRLTCETVGNLDFILPPIQDQIDMVKELEKINYKKAQLEKGFEDLIIK